ncbi:MAG: small subunit ribosomal protein, partial [Actinomycetota bacterium]|nr:small subunit ribosomal protein [Actinomycetota bacterium]
AIRSIQVLSRVIADAVAEGLMARAGAWAAGDEKPEAGQLGTDEPLPEWEQELLTGGAASAAGVDTAAVEGAGAAEAPATEAVPAAAEAAPAAADQA